MSKKNGKVNGNGHDQAPLVTTLSEDLALSIAHGAAASAFDLVRAHAARDSDVLLAGRFWYSAGRSIAGGSDVDRVKALAKFVIDHPDAPGEAVYRFACSIIKRDSADWSDLPLAERQAFGVFAATLTPLIAEVRAELRRSQAAPKPLPPPADHGVYRRTTRKQGGIFRKLNMMPPNATRPR